MPIIKRDEIKIIHEEADRTALVKYSARMSPASVFGPREQRAQLPAALCRIGKADKLSVLIRREGQFSSLPELGKILSVRIPRTVV